MNGSGPEDGPDLPDTGEHALAELPPAFRKRFPGACAVLGAHPAELLRAPERLLAPAYGELFGSFAAAADAVLAEVLDPGPPPLREEARLRFGEALRTATLHPKELLDGDEGALAEFVGGLRAAADAVAEAGSVQPVSGAENLFADTWDLAGLRGPDGLRVSRGREVALGCLCSFVFYGKLFERPFAEDDIPGALATAPDRAGREAAVRSMLPAGPVLDAALAESLAKHREGAALEERLTLAADRWEELRGRCDALLMRPERAAAMLRAARCRPAPPELGLSPARAAATAIVAQTLSRRTTVLDLAYETGRFAACIGAVAEAFS